MIEEVLVVMGVACDMCVAKVTRAVQGIPGVDSVEVFFWIE